MKPFLDELSDVAVPVLEKLIPVSPPLRWVSLANGDADFHDNVIFFGWSRQQADPVVVAKVPRLVENGWMLKTEYDHLMELWACLGEQAVNYIPRPYALASIQERPVLMLSYIPGESLTRLSPKSFWNDREKVAGLAREAAQTLRVLNQLAERPIQSGEAVEINWKAKAAKFRELFQPKTEEAHALDELVRTVSSKSKTASHKVLIQGDFWHGNMIRDRKWGRLRFVDWQFARWSVDVSLDVYFFLLAGALSATGNGPVEARAAQAFHLLSSWRQDVIPEYLALYGHPHHYMLLPQKSGMMLCCVEKAVRSTLEFGYSHSDDLLWRCLFSELMYWPDEPGSKTEASV